MGTTQRAKVGGARVHLETGFVGSIKLVVAVDNGDGWVVWVHWGMWMYVVCM